MKFIFVTGGVISGVGKGVAAASIGKILQSYGFSVTIIKIDPYINCDAGTLRPTEHGEVWVTDDGGEIDQDLGNYERFLGADIPKKNNITTGQVYREIIRKERSGKFLGQTVQFIPHVPDEIKQRIKEAGKGHDFVIIEIGGTIGDYENLPFLFAAKSLEIEYGKENVANILVSYLPIPKNVGEMKTKPTQHSVMKLREIGLQPDMLLCRTDRPLENSDRDKIALFCSIPPEMVIEARDEESIYQIPLSYTKYSVGEKVAARLGLPNRQADLKGWKTFVSKVKNPTHYVRIGICGKYTELRDSYKSIIEAFVHAGVDNDAKVELKWLDSEKMNRENAHTFFNDISGLLVPGGFGERGSEGKIAAINYARTANLPFFGICLGLQCAIIEFARSVCGMEGANSTEFDPETPHPVIDLMETQIDVTEMGGTMRLGAWDCTLVKNSLAFQAYGKSKISERHRHRYEVNNNYVSTLQEHGLKVAGTNPNSGLVEVIEIADHPWFVGVQYHPELKSRVLDTHPLFREFVRAAIEHKLSKTEADWEEDDNEDS